MARPKKSASLRMDSELRIKLTAAQRKAIDSAAKKQTLESSTWARTVLVREAEKINKPIASEASVPIESVQDRSRSEEPASVATTAREG